MTDKGVSHEQDVGRSALLPSFARPRRRPVGTAGGPTTTGVEIALVPACFGAFGWWLDGRLGTRPVLLIALLAFAVVGMFVKTWIGYDAAMRREELRAPWARGPVRPVVDATTPVPADDTAQVIDEDQR